MESRTKRKFFSLIILVLVTAFVSCKKKDSPIIDSIKIELPSITTTEIWDIADKQAVSGGVITSDGGSVLVACGVCWSNDSTTWNFGKSDTSYYPNIIKIQGNFSFTGSIINLSPSKRYFVKAYATNKIGTSYGQTISFTTTAPVVTQINFNPAVNYTSIHDQDENTYRTVTIGNQVWMAENLKTITYNDGMSIPRKSGYCWYNNDVNSNNATFGAMYSWGSVSAGNLCPVGWHIPSMDEWKILSNYLGGTDIAGGKLKEIGTVHWTNSNVGATNTSGFTALPGGIFSFNRYNLFNNIDSSGYYWSSFQNTERQAGITITRWEFIKMDFNAEYITFIVSPVTPFMAVRCIKD